MAAALAVVALVAAGVPLAYALTRDLVVAVVLAPLVTGLQCTVAAVAMLLAGGPDLASAPFAPWLAAVTAASWALAAVLVRRRPRAPLPGLGVVDLLVMYGPLLLPALLVRRPPVAWDARSIWWFHAAWIDGGPAAFRDALGNAALAFSHADYPPLAPAAVAGAWTVTGGSGLWVAQVTSTVLTLSAAAVLAYVVRHLVPAVHPMAARLVALAVALGLWTSADYGIAGGYVDHLWAAAAAAGAALLFVDGSILPPGGAAPGPSGGAGGRSGARPGHLALAVVLLSVAALTKNEGLVAAGVVAVLFTVRARGAWRAAAWVWVPVVAGAAWTVLARGFGATSDLSSSPRIGELLGGDLSPLERVGPTVEQLRTHLGWVLAGAALVTLVGVATLRARRRALGVVPVGWPWALLVVYLAALVGTYVVSPHDLTWHLTTSIDRVVVLAILVALVIVASWVLVALAPDPVAPGPDRAAEGAAAGAVEPAGREPRPAARTG